MELPKLKCRLLNRTLKRAAWTIFLFFFMLLELLQPITVAADEIYTANANGTASIINTTDSSISTFPLNVPNNATPSALCLNPVTSHAYTINSGDNTLSIFDTQKKTALATITDQRFTGLTTIACSPDGTIVVVGNNSANGLSSQILYLDTSTNTIDPASASVDLNPASIVFNKTGTKAYVLSQDAPSISVIDMKDRQITSITPLTNPDDVPFALAMHTKDTYLYVVNMIGNSVTFIDPATMATVTTISLPAAGFNFPHALTVSASSDKVYVADYLDTISVIEPATKSVLTSFASPFPGSLLEQNDGQQLYVTSESDTSTDTIKSYITASLVTPPADINLPAGSAPKALATLTGSSQLLGLSQSGEGSGTVGWPYNQSYASPSIPTATYVRAPEGISITTKAQAGACSNVRWFGCDSVLDNGSHSASCVIGPLTSGRTLYPEYFPSAVYPLTFPDTGINGAVTCSDSSVCDGSTATCSFIPNTNYHIDTISIDAVPTTITNAKYQTYTFSNISSAHSVDATFVIDTFPVSATAGNNGTISPLGITSINYGSNLSYVITPEINHHIADVQIDGTSAGPITNYTFSNIAAPHTISASFAIDTFAISASASDFGTISPAGSTAVNYGLDQTYIITPATGYHVTDVLVDGVSVGPVTSYTFITVKAPHTISASFAIDSFTITAAATGNGTISPAGATTVNYGSNQSYTISPATGYHVADVLVDGISIGAMNSYTFSIVQAPHTISATFAIDTFTITATSGTNGAISPSGETMTTYGQTVTYAMIPDIGYHVATIAVDGVNIEPASSYTFNNLSGAHTIAVSFAIDTFTIVPTAGSGGSITPDTAQNVTYNNSTHFDITPSTGYIITDVLVDGISQGALTSYTFSNVTNAHTIEAHFADIFAPDVFIQPNSLDGSATQQTSATFSFTSSDPTATFECNLDSIGFTPCTNPASFSNLPQGSHTFSVRAKDFSGNVSQQPALSSWIVDTTAPLDCTMSVTAGNGTAYLDCPNPSDIYSGIASLLLQFGTTGSPLPDYCPDGVSFDPYTSNALTLTNGISYDFRICAIDGAGNISAGTPVLSATPRYTFLNLSPTVLNFNSQNINSNSAPSMVTLTNTNDYGMTIERIELIGAHALNFNLGPEGNCAQPPFYLDLHEQCTVAVHFQPTTASSGISHSALVVTSGEDGNPAISTTLSGIATFDISASVGSNGSISPSGMITANDGTNQIFTITPDAGYRIANVMVDGISVGAVTNYSFNNVTANHSISATFTADTYTISADINGNGTITPGGITTLPAGSAQSYSITPAAGYHISSVLVDGISIGAVSSYNFTAISAPHTIQANFAIDSYPISVMVIGSGTVTPPSTPLTYGASRTYTMTPNTGYHVSKVLVDNINIGAVPTYTFDTISASHSLAVTFDINTYEITSSATTGGSITPTTTVNYLSSKIITISPATGYKIADVLVDGISVGAVASYSFKNVVAPHTISAVFALDTFTITSISGAHGTISPAGVATVTYGSAPTYTITPDPGYHVTGILVDGTSAGAVSSYTFSSINTSHTISASFALNTYSITATASVGGSISPTTLVNYQDNATFTITPAVGYHIEDIKIDGASVSTTNTYTFTSVTSDHTINASFAKDSLIISSSANAHGTISPIGSTTVSYGANNTYTITPDTGYRIASVLIDGVNAGALSSYTFNAVTAAHTISANFIADVVAITASATPGGSVSSSSPVPYGSSQNIVLTPSIGYHLTELTDNGTNVLAAVTNKTQYTIASVTAPHTIHATFSSYALTDALQALRAAVGMTLVKPEEMIWLDVAPLEVGKPKGDGAITIQDAYTLLRRQIGLYNF